VLYFRGDSPPLIAGDDVDQHCRLT